MKIIGIILIIIGLVISVVTGFNFTSEEKIVDLGKIEVVKENEHQINWPPITGIVLMAVGGAIFMIGRKKAL